MKLYYTKKTDENIDDIFDYIATDSFQFAYLTTTNIYSRISNLEIFPYIGRIVPEIPNQQYRELIYKNYRIVYEISKIKNIIFVHFIINSKRNFKSFYNSYINKN